MDESFNNYDQQINDSPQRPNRKHFHKCKPKRTQTKICIGSRRNFWSTLQLGLHRRICSQRERNLRWVTAVDCRYTMHAIIRVFCSKFCGWSDDPHSLSLWLEFTSRVSDEWERVSENDDTTDTQREAQCFSKDGKTLDLFPRFIGMRSE